jgi:predicted ATPase/DNA-binding SARP family transcriptional activator
MMTVDATTQREPLWRIGLLGGLCLQHQGKTLRHLKTRRMTLLLARLACFPEQSHPRDVLAEELWPEEDPDTIRERFRQTLALLRRELEPADISSGSVLIADRSSVRLAPYSFSTDIGDFESAFRVDIREQNSLRQIEHLQKVVSFYGGDFLPGFYEDWVLIRRRHLAELYRQALSRLSEALAATAQFDDAIEAAQKAVLTDPFQEESHCALIRLFALAGRPLDAHRQYEEWEHLLREKLQAEPSVDTRKLMEQIRSGVFAVSPASRLSTPSALPAYELPVPLTRFFGREWEILQLESLLAPVKSLSPSPPRLVTITGLGGAGKTRLALELAHRLLPLYDDKVWFIPLADVSQASLIPDAVLEALSVTRSSQSRSLDQLIDVLRTSSLALLILDNFEHLQEDGATVVQTLRQRLPRLTFLITSRYKLGVEGERDLALPPLKTPESLEAPEQLLAYPSIQLFLDRAQAARYSFSLTTENADSMSRLGQCLEGLPLAIELAAAWAATLTPEQILTRLSYRFDLLVSRRSDVVERHRSLQAVLEGSYQLLPPKLQQFYARLSVFRGGWTLEAAEKIASQSAQSSPLGFTNLDALALLHERSFIQAEERGAEMRYRLLESLREFGAEQLEASEKAALERRHAGFFLALVEEAQTHLRTPGEKKAFDKLEAELDNLRAALEWAIAQEPEMALRMSALLGSFWMTRGFVREGEQWLRKALGQELETSIARADALNCLALMKMSQGDYNEGEKWARESLSAQRTFQNSMGIAKSLNTLGAIIMEKGDYPEARACYEECLSLYRETGNRMGEAVVLANLGNVVYALGEYTLACTYYDACLEARRAMGDQRGIASALDYLARAVREQGDYRRACDLHTESLAMRRTLQDKHGIALALNHLGRIKNFLEEREEARLFLEESLPYWRELGDKMGLAEALSQLGQLFLQESDRETARQHWSESLEIIRESGDLSSLAGLMEAFASLAVLESHFYAAAQLLGRADVIRKEISNPHQPTTRSQYERIVSSVREALGEECFLQAWTEGVGMTNEKAILLAK